MIIKSITKKTSMNNRVKYLSYYSQFVATWNWPESYLDEFICCNLEITFNTVFTPHYRVVTTSIKK